MPRLYERVAKTDLYEGGLRTHASNKQGFSLDRRKPFIHVPGGPLDRVIVHKGQKYFAWHPKGRSWQYSLKKPDLRPAWDKELSDFEDRVDNCEYDEREDLKSEIETRRDELQTNYDNMPDVFQTEDHVLKERITALEELMEKIEQYE